MVSWFKGNAKRQKVSGENRYFDRTYYMRTNAPRWSSRNYDSFALEGYINNVGNIWIKKPLDGRGYRLVHDNGKRSHLIGYVTEKSEVVVFTNTDNEILSMTIDGRTISGFGNK